MITIDELIELLELTTGPDRWLDAKIDAAFRIGSEKMRGVGYEWAWDNFPVWAHHKQARGMCGVQHNNGDLGLIWDSPAFTASVDAALMLAERVLPGWIVQFQTMPKCLRAGVPAPVAGASVFPDDVSMQQLEAALGDGDAVEIHSYPAIAIVLAILKAVKP